MYLPGISNVSIRDIAIIVISVSCLVVILNTLFYIIRHLYGLLYYLVMLGALVCVSLIMCNQLNLINTPRISKLQDNVYNYVREGAKTTNLIYQVGTSLSLLKKTEAIEPIDKKIDPNNESKNK